MAECYEYQQFMEVFAKLKENLVPSVSSLPKDFRSCTEEDCQNLGQSLKYKIGLDLHRAKVFEIDNRTKRAMLMTVIPKDRSILSTMRLPYQAIFLDLTIDNDDEDIGYGNKIVGVLISEQEIQANDWVFGAFFILHKEMGISLEHFKISFTEIKDEIQYAEGTKNLQDILKRLIINTILFINEPEVQWVERKRSEKNSERRVRQGKNPLPNSFVVKLTGSLKKYFDEHGQDFEGKGYSFKFDVRGTWRHFRSSRFKRIRSLAQEEMEREGYRIRDGYVCRWIAPFKKGEGVYVKKTYSLERPLAENELDLDAIKPLKKLLCEDKAK